MYDDDDLDADGWDNSQVSDCDSENYENMAVSAMMNCDSMMRAHDGMVAWPIQRLEEAYISRAKQHIEDHGHSHFDTLRDIFRAMEICRQRVLEIEARKREFLNKRHGTAA